MTSSSGSPAATREFLRTLARFEFTSAAPAIERQLATLLTVPHLDHQEIVNPALSLLRADPQIANALSAARESFGILAPDQMETIAPTLDRPLVHGLLRYTILTDIGFELLFHALRRYLLTQYATAGATAVSPWLPLAVSIAVQSANNQYAFWEEDGEGAMVDELVARAKSGERPATELGIVSALIGMYAHPYSFLEGARDRERFENAMPDDLRRLVQEAEDERRMAATIPVIAKINDDISQAVQEQYELFPYPRWISCEFGPARDLAEMIGRCVHQDFAIDGPAASRPLQAFVPGCGTGRHPLDLATALRDCEVLAMDLSRASLGYAMRKAKEYGIDNVRFVQGDLLAMDTASYAFDVIEAAGVIHHTRDPQAALNKLAAMLKPKGFIEIGIYGSERSARLRSVRELRDRSQLDRSASALRAFRRLVTREFMLDPTAAILKYFDFYNLGGVRDILFHVQEQEFSLPEIKTLLRNAGLRFIGFRDVSKDHREEFDRTFPGRRSDFDAWISFAKHSPNFLSFWAQKY